MDIIQYLWIYILILSMLLLLLLLLLYYSHFQILLFLSKFFLQAFICLFIILIHFFQLQHLFIWYINLLYDGLTILNLYVLFISNPALISLSFYR